MLDLLLADFELAGLSGARPRTHVIRMSEQENLIQAQGTALVHNEHICLSAEPTCGDSLHMKQTVS